MKHPIIQELETTLTEPTRLEKFSKVAKMAHSCSDEMAETIVLAELQLFCNRLGAIDLTKHQLTLDRGKAIFLEVLMAGLSFSPTADHVYVQPSFNNVSQLTYYLSPYGKLFMCQNAGSVDYVTKPVIAYEGDTFRVGTNETGNQIVLHSAIQHPEKKPPIIAGYVFVVTPKGSREPFWMDKADVERIRAKSRKNALYQSQNGDIDSGFFGGKLIKHALKAFRTKAVIALPEDDGIEDAETPISVDAVSQQATQTATYQVAPPQQPLYMPPGYPIQPPIQETQPQDFGQPPATVTTDFNTAPAQSFGPPPPGLPF